jgi:putative glycosyltransferase (TIGR04372 family)
LLRERSTFAIPDSLLGRARAEAASRGVPPEARVVAIEGPLRRDVAAAVVRELSAAGYTAVRVGTATDSWSGVGAIDLTAHPSRSTLVNLFVLCTARFVICGSLEWQQLAYVANTPSLTVNATDPFAAYPLRADGLLLLRTVLDLDSGRVLTLDDLLSERHFRNVRNCGYRDNTAAELTAAVGEMRASLEHGWHESDGQRRFRARATDAAQRLAASTPALAEWAPDSGFIGDGRLARVQADRAS